eukprot:TRINITY_DN4404_c0_g1_i2.p1 TRINITY_DN4404_c0_g1~~TRINITY_DN4404_c0_g1_i2.p1  ORF type:complete len:683 (-),score=153.90 TRINITY_DN4404_c0_g1_i2:164-2212(-)
MPKYRQFGAPVQLKPGVKYLALEIVQADNLPKTDENGYTDCFFVAEWEGMRQKTKVVLKSLNPKFGERLYFPILLYKFDEETLGQKEPFVKLTAYDYDDDGTSDFHGHVSFGLHEINDCRETTIEDIMDTRILEKTVKLDQCSNPKASVTFRAWFTPKLEDEDGNEIFLEAPKETEKKRLPEEFKERETSWERSIREIAPRAFKKARRYGGFTYKAMDERAIEHFLPAYLAPMQGPLDLTNPKEVVRMVSSITFEADAETLKVGDGDNSWASPKFFLDVKKGDAEDHAIMLANMLLGLQFDTYLCTGRAFVRIVDEATDEETIGPSEDEHVWVMVRWPNGTVSHFETITGFEYRLEERWTGCEEQDSEDEEEPVAPAEGAEGELGLVDNQEEEENDTFQLFFEAEAPLAQDMMSPEDGMAALRAMFEGANVGDDDTDSGPDYPDPQPERFAPYATLQTIANHENCWANVQYSLNPNKCMYEIDSTDQWKPFCSFDDGFTPDDKLKAAFYDDPQIAGRLKQGKANDLATKILFILKEGVRFRREKDMLDTDIWEFDPEADPPQPGNITQVLSKGLKLMEEQMIVEEKTEQARVARRLQLWKAEIQRCVPKNMGFEGIPINFSFSDAKRIKNRIIDRFEDWILEEAEDEFQFAFGACCCPYYCGVNSTWIYVCKIRPLPPEEDE